MELMGISNIRLKHVSKSKKKGEIVNVYIYMVANVKHNFPVRDAMWSRRSLMTHYIHLEGRGLSQVNMQ
jgi:hypothetical protein